MLCIGITTPKFKSHVSNHQSQNLGRKFIVFTCFWPIVKILLRKKVTASQNSYILDKIYIGLVSEVFVQGSDETRVVKIRDHDPGLMNICVYPCVRILPRPQTHPQNVCLQRRIGYRWPVTSFRAGPSARGGNAFTLLTIRFSSDPLTKTPDTVLLKILAKCV